MRIERENGEEVGDVWAVGTREDLELLLESLFYYFEQDPPDPGWHCHIGELTVALEGA